MTTDIDTDDGIRCEKVSHSRSHTVSDTELDCELARLKKRKVYQKKKGQSHTANTTDNITTTGYLSPTVSGDNMSEIIQCCNEMKSEETEVVVVVQLTSAIVKEEKADELPGKFQRNIINNSLVYMYYNNCHTLVNHLTIYRAQVRSWNSSSMSSS